MKADDLITFEGKRVIVQEDITHLGSDEDFREVEGTVGKADATGLVLQTSKGVTIIPVARILDVEVKLPNRLQRRWLREAGASTVRQHLLDRHGMPFDLIAAQGVDHKLYLEMHSKIDHGNLGHQHGVRPPSTRGRKKLSTGEEVEEVDG
jgi:hypothetical protein